MTIRGSNGYFGRAKFKTYLRNLPPNEIVGIRGQTENCPIAGFLAELIPEHDADTIVASDDTLEYSVNGHYHEHNSPAWVTAFIATIDAAGDGYAGVTAREALAALD